MFQTNMARIAVATHVKAVGYAADKMKTGLLQVVSRI